MRDQPARSPSDVDVLAGAVFVLAGAFASNPLLHVVVDEESASTLLSRLAPSQTLDRLWVVFVLIPAVIAFVGIGVPYGFRVMLAAIRGRLDRAQGMTALALAFCSALVAADLVMQRSGILPLLLTCAVALWRGGPSLRALGARFAPTSLVVAGGALLGLAFYQRQIQAGGEASIAIAPTLVLIGFYAGLTGVLGALLAATAPRAKGWLGAVSAAVAVGWGGGLRALPLFGARSGSAELALTLAAGAALVALAVWSRRSPPPAATERDFR